MEDCIFNIMEKMPYDKNFIFQFNIPTRIYAGKGEIKRLKKVINNLGERILIISMEDLSEMINNVINYIKPIPSIYYELILLKNIEPRCHDIDHLKQKIKNKKFDIIIGLGGGSAIDTAKALSIALTHSEPIWLYANLSNRPPLPLLKPLIPIVAIPTTAGTGSEVTPYAILTNSEINQKGTIQEIALFPKVAFLDPTFTRTMPPELTATTGIDAFIHALESYINISKYSPVAEWAARGAMSIIYQTLSEVYKNLDNIELRLKMSWASTLAGIAISHRGTTAIHAIAEPLGAITHIPHSVAVAICTLPVLKYTWYKTIKKFAFLYEIFEPSKKFGKSDIDKAKKSIELIENMFKQVNIFKKVRVKDYIKIENIADKLLEDVIKYKFRPLAQHPVEFSKKELKIIINEILK